LNPTTGGGIAGAAYAGQYAGEQAIAALDAGDVSEEMLWPYNERVMDHFGARYAGLDVYNILATAVDVDDLMGLLASLPGEKLAEALYSGTTSFGPRLLVKTAVDSFGYWRQILGFYRTKRVADELLGQYDTYPAAPGDLGAWQRDRDELMDRLYSLTGARPKY
jgi:flavin-dependent dehydrogenase